MNIRVLILYSSLFLALPLFARENTDVIVMKNNDHLTGQIKGLDGGVLYLSLPYVIQTISVDWSQVARLESKQLFLVKTADGSVLPGDPQQHRIARRSSHPDSGGGSPREECDPR